MSLLLNTSWITGKYPELDAEINDAYSTVSIGDQFCQGSEADTVISEIHDIWVNNDCSVEQAVAAWINMNL